jgi:hypothetical protein
MRVTDQLKSLRIFRRVRPAMGSPEWARERRVWALDSSKLNTAGTSSEACRRCARQHQSTGLELVVQFSRLQAAGVEIAERCSVGGAVEFGRVRFGHGDDPLCLVVVGSFTVRCVRAFSHATSRLRRPPRVRLPAEASRTGQVIPFTVGELSRNVCRELT